MIETRRRYLVPRRGPANERICPITQEAHHTPRTCLAKGALASACRAGTYTPSLGSKGTRRVWFRALSQRHCAGGRPTRK